MLSNFAKRYCLKC